MVRSLSLSLVLLSLWACRPPELRYNYLNLPNPTTQVYRVQAGDVINVRVLRNENTSGRYTVRPDGSISLPLGGEIAVRGLTTEEVRRSIVGAVRKYIEDANEMVAVSLEQVRGITYSVIGEVTRAGTFESPRFVTLLEALANAGGLTPYAKVHSVYVLRQDNRRQFKIPVSYPKTVASPTRNRNFYLLSGDIVVVP